MIDQEVLMERFGGMELLPRFYGHFHEQLPSQLVAIQEALQKQDSKELEETAHRLKGAIANFSTDEAFTVAAELEKMGRENKIDNASAQFERLKLSLDSFNIEMTEFLESNKAAN
jgi:HPt (histidine-containing phosphotransfer) domain-containing protein